MATDMYGDMTGPSAWMMTASWDGTHVALLFAMWTAMMTGMMLPSAAPTLLVYGMVARRDDAADAPLRVHLFAGGYLVVWTAFSAVATAGAAGVHQHGRAVADDGERSAPVVGRRHARRRRRSISSRRSSAPASAPASRRPRSW